MNTAKYRLTRKHYRRSRQGGDEVFVAGDVFVPTDAELANPLLASRLELVAEPQVVVPQQAQAEVAVTFEVQGPVTQETVKEVVQQVATVIATDTQEAAKQLTEALKPKEEPEPVTKKEPTTFEEMVDAYSVNKLVDLVSKSQLDPAKVLEHERTSRGRKTLIFQLEELIKSKA